METAVLPAVIEEARRRQRRRQFLALGVVGLAIAGALAYTLPGGGGNRTPAASSKHASGTPVTAPSHAVAATITLTVLSGSSDGRRHFTGDLAIFHRPRRPEDVIPNAILKGQHGFSVASYLARAKGDHGRLVLSSSRALDTFDKTVYVAHTTGRWVCMVSWNSFGCLPSLNRQWISWDFTNDGDTALLFVGIAPDIVSRIDLVSDSGHGRATLSGNLFWLEWQVPVHPDPFINLHPRFVVHYRDGRPPATVPID